LNVIFGPALTTSSKQARKELIVSAGQRIPSLLVFIGVRTLRTQDTSDLRQFGSISLVPKCLTFFVSQHFMKGPNVSNGHFGTSAEVSRTDRRRLHVLLSLHHLMSHLHHPSRSSDSVSRHFVYTKSYPTFTFDSLTLLRPRKQFR